MMYSSLDEELFFTQKVILKKKYQNRELALHKYFWQKTKVFPDCIIIINNFIVFFVNAKDYFKAKAYLREFRTELMERKVLILRVEKTLVKFILNFFPDPYIHDIKLEYDEQLGLRTIIIYLYSYEERGIAIGRSGDYIKVINEILKDYVMFEEYATFKKYYIPIEVKCESINP